MRSLELKIPPIVIVLLAAVAMSLISRSTPAFSIPPAYRYAILALLAVLALALAVPALSAFRRNRTTLSPTSPSEASALIRTGVFRLSRNPLYLALLLALAGYAVYLSNPAALLVLPVFVLYMTRFQIIPEERTLRAKFGDEYTRYLQSVRRWI